MGSAAALPPKIILPAQKTCVMYRSICCKHTMKTSFYRSKTIY